jgi:hypothetical protein
VNGITASVQKKRMSSENGHENNESANEPVMKNVAASDLGKVVNLMQ